MKPSSVQCQSLFLLYHAMEQKSGNEGEGHLSDGKDVCWQRDETHEAIRA